MKRIELKTTAEIPAFTLLAIPSILVKAWLILSLLSSGISALSGTCGKQTVMSGWVADELMCPVEDSTTRR